MLKNRPAFSSFSVGSTSEAKAFYEDTLGLSVEEKYGGLQLHFSGNEPIMVYPKDNHKPATFTVLNFVVDDIERAVDDLAKKGVVFEHYDDEIQTNEKGIAEHAGGPKMAWFKDPAGNILGLLQTPKA